MPQAIPLWSDAAETLASAQGEKPTLTPFLCEDPGASILVIVCPGGGYASLSHHEGPVVAQWLNGHGFHAAVLRYRVAPNRHPAPIHDALRAIRLARHHAKKWRVDPQRIAILGFSAGGHLASTAATHFDRFACESDDLRGGVSARPDAAVLCYPVIDMGAWANVGSVKNLLGEPADPAAAELLSNQKQVTRETPPTFLWHTADDSIVAMENATLFAMACRAARVPVELHVYDSGQHGLGLAPGMPNVATWGDHCLSFLRRHLVK